jgi:hypothetical protein
VKPGCEKYLKAIEAYIIQDSPVEPALWEETLAHVKNCEACRRFYDRLHQAEDLLCAESDVNRPADERLLSTILPGETTKDQTIWLRHTSLIAAAAVLLIVVLGTYWYLLADSCDFVVRGDSQKPALEAPRLRALCLLPEQSGQLQAKSLPRAQSSKEAAGCPLEGILKFVVTNPDDDNRYLLVIGQNQAGELRYYFPSPKEVKSYAIATSKTEQNFGEGVRLQINHQPEKVRIYALFSQEALELTEIGRLLEENYEAEGQPPKSLDLKKISSQHSFWVKITD